MFETILYVPWIAALVSYCIAYFWKQPLLSFAGSLLAIFLLTLIELSDYGQDFDPVQAVLDSQFWLATHVMMVVGSYGLFALGAIIAHFYLGSIAIYKKEIPSLIPPIVQALYSGTFLLITGTILGGIWAAQSWGRFWDWDPKESWACISSCTYLLFIHAYRFHHIGPFGLALGAIIGMFAISFTWYGVNYILGTGLHSYGFGSGGETYYYAFLLLEIGFLSLAWIRFKFSSKTLTHFEKHK